MRGEGEAFGQSFEQSQKFPFPPQKIINQCFLNISLINKRKMGVKLLDLAPKLNYILDMEKTIAIFLPPLPHLSGGMLVLIQIGNHLASLGHTVHFVVHDGELDFIGYSEVYDRTTIPIVHWSSLELSPEHVWIVPDGWTNALVVGIKAGARCIMYIQNWAFSLRTLPENVFWQNLPVEFMYVSEPVRNFVREITGKDGPIVRPGIDLNLFYTLPKNPLGERTKNNPIRIAWMPRKNKVFGELVNDALQQRMSRLYPHIPIQFVPIQRVPHHEVANILRTCHIFLVTGFPEGCPLPPLEAMASGCIPVGFTGFGGWDYMRQFNITDSEMPYLAKPWFELSERGFGGNGFYVEDAHVLAATLALEQAVVLVHEDSAAYKEICQNLSATAQEYSDEKQKINIELLINYLVK